MRRKKDYLELEELKGKTKLTYISYRWGERELFRDYILLGDWELKYSGVYGSELEYYLGEKHGRPCFVFNFPFYYYASNPDSKWDKMQDCDLFLKYNFANNNWRGHFGIFGFDLYMHPGFKTFAKVAWALRNALRGHYRKFGTKRFQAGIAIDFSQLLSNRKSLALFIKFLYLLDYRCYSVFKYYNYLEFVPLKVAPILSKQIEFLIDPAPLKPKEIVRIASLVSLMRTEGLWNYSFHFDLLDKIYDKAKLVEKLTDLIENVDLSIPGPGRGSIPYLLVANAGGLDVVRAYHGAAPQDRLKILGQFIKEPRESLVSLDFDVLDLSMFWEFDKRRALYEGLSEFYSKLYEDVDLLEDYKPGGFLR